MSGARGRDQIVRSPGVAACGESSDQQRGYSCGKLQMQKEIGVGVEVTMGMRFSTELAIDVLEFCTHRLQFTCPLCYSYSV